MEISILLFGVTTDLVGTNSLSLSIDENTSVSQLKEVLMTNYPQLSKINSYAIAVNEAYASNETIISKGDVVAVIPPVSGG